MVYRRKSDSDSSDREIVSQKFVRDNSVLDFEIASMVTALNIEPNQHSVSPVSAADRKRNYAIDLSGRERNVISELQNALKIFVDERTLPEARETTNIFEILSWPRLYAKKVIKFCKSIQTFKHLNENDQLIILKKSYFQILFVRSVFAFDIPRNGYHVMEVS